MQTALLLMLAVGAVSLGVGITLLIATRVPAAALTRAQAHGRFAGLGSADRDDGTGRVARERGTEAAARPGTLAHA